MTACRWRLYMIVILSIISPAIISTHSLAHLVISHCTPDKLPAQIPVTHLHTLSITAHLSDYQWHNSKSLALLSVISPVRPGFKAQCFAYLLIIKPVMSPVKHSQSLHTCQSFHVTVNHDTQAGHTWPAISHITTQHNNYTVSQKKLSRFVFVRTSSNFHQFR